MLELSAFGSLAQLGAGLALAIAIFVEPIAVRERNARQKLTGALVVLPNSAEESIQARSNHLWGEMIRLDANAKAAHEASWLPLLLIKIGALINFLILLAATVAPDAELTAPWMWILLALSIAPVFIGVGWVSILAHWKIVMPEI